MAAITRCGHTVVDLDGMDGPCDRPVTGWRWYQDVEHEDTLEAACGYHANEGGRRLHAAEAELDRLRLSQDYTPDGVAIVMGQLTDTRRERDEARAALDRVRALAESAPVLTYDNGYRAQAVPKAELLGVIALATPAPADAEDGGPRCAKDIGDATVCPCLLPRGHEGLHACKHDARVGGPQ